MDRSELTMAVAGALVGGVPLRLDLPLGVRADERARAARRRRTADMASELHAAEEARHRAELRLAEVEAAAARRVAKVEAELALTREAFAGAQAQADEVRAAYRRAMGGAEGVEPE